MSSVKMEDKSRFKGTNRPHLTKKERLPQFIKDSEKVIRSVKSCKSNFKTVLANSRFRGIHFKKVYALTLNVLKHYDYIQCIIEELKLLEKEKNLRRELATILIYEVIFGKGQLSGESKPVITIQGYTDDIMKAHQNLQYSDSFSLKGFDLPRYARIHTLVTTVPYVVKDLIDIGFQQVFYDESISEEKYIELVRSLQSGSFMVDLHFKELLVFGHGENLLNLELYQKGHIFLQDKSSYIPVHVLNPEPGSAVLDACAAPGMKSLHMAAKMKNKGVLLVCERDKTRFETLKEMIEHGGVKICKLFCKDFKLMDPDDQAHCSLDYILLDPSCSGSGMVNRMDEVTDTEDSKNKDRLQKLAGFQIVLLKHALKFPSVKRVVYSTCSINEEENEYVVHEALNAFSNSFKLVSVMPEWSTRGSKNYEYGELCLRTLPEKHLTNGFFVAMFERLDGLENNIKNSQKHKGKKMKVEGEDLDNNQNDVNVDIYSSSKRKKYLHDSHLSVEGGNEAFEHNGDSSSSNKKDKYRLCNSESSNTFEETYESTAENSEESNHLFNSYVPESNEQPIPEYSAKHKKRKKKDMENRCEYENQSDCLNQIIGTDMDLSQKFKKEKKNKVKDIKMKKYENNEDSQQLESTLRKSDVNVDVEFQNSEIIDSSRVKHKKNKKRRNESEIVEIHEVTKDCEKNEFASTESKNKKRSKDKMKKYENNKESQQLQISSRQNSADIDVEFQNSEIIDSSMVKRKKNKKRNKSEIVEILEVTKDCEKEEFLSTGSKKRKYNQGEILNCDVHNFLKETSERDKSQSILFDESGDNIESDTTKHKKKHHKKRHQDNIKDSFAYTQTLKREKMPEIHENLEKNKSLIKKMKKHKHSKKYMCENHDDQVRIDEKMSNCLSLNIIDNAENGLTKKVKKKKCKNTMEYSNDLDISLKLNEKRKTKNMNSEVKNEENVSYLLPESINDLECKTTKHKKNKLKKH